MTYFKNKKNSLFRRTFLPIFGHKNCYVVKKGSNYKKIPFLKYFYIVFLIKKLREIFATSCSPIETSNEPTVRGVALVATEWWRVCLFHHAISGRFLRWPSKSSKCDTSCLPVTSRASPVTIGY
jgi:hypothetical protein